MTDQGYRHRLTSDQKQMTDRQLAATLPEGTGVSVAKYGSYWDVVLRVKDGKTEYIVTDSSTGDGRKPVRVHGPVSKEEAQTWAKTTAQLFYATHRQQPEWPWE